MRCGNCGGVSFLLQEADRAWCQTCGALYLRHCSTDSGPTWKAPTRFSPGPRVIIVIRGGNFQGARANGQVQLDVLDYDNLQELERVAQAGVEVTNEVARLRQLELAFERLPDSQVQ